MRNEIIRKLLVIQLIAASVVFFALSAFGQSGSTRPRRVAPVDTSRTGESTSTASKTTSQTNQGGLLDVRPYGTNATTTPPRTSAPNAAHAFELLQQKQYEAALKEAQQVKISEPTNDEAWKIAGFAELNLKKYAEASEDLQHAYDLQKSAKREDTNTADALGQALARSEQYSRALPFLVAMTSRPGEEPDPPTLYLRAYAEYKSGKREDAERTFNAVVKANPKDTASLFMLGQLAYERNDMDAAVVSLNRATAIDAKVAASWTLLASAYLRRAAGTADDAKSEADYQGAVRACEGLQRIKSDHETTLLMAQALIGAKQYPRVISMLERASAASDAPGSVFFLLGFSYSRSQNFPKAIIALERAATKTPEDVNVYRELGYAYEMTKQYPKAFGAYEKGSALAPNDQDFKNSLDRLRPVVKP